MKHIPVLYKECLEFLKINSEGVYYDATFGAGGHSGGILSLNPKKLYSTDKDISVKPNIDNYGDNFQFIHSDFVSFLENPLYKHIKFDGILADFGISSMQVDIADRGFSFSKDGPLDMRMDRSQKLTAADVVNSYSEAKLAEIIKNYGEEPAARVIARYIVKNRPFYRTKELAAVIKSMYRKKIKIDPATKTFQAIRIEVNGELLKIEKFLDLAVERLNIGGRVVVISFHSLEDRVVKRKFLTLQKGCICPPKLPCVCDKKPEGKIITKKPITPSKDEISDNPRSRSAKLRVFERLNLEKNNR